MRRWLWLVALQVAIGGGGGMVNGPTQHVKISTIPPGATVHVDGRQLRSPVYVDLVRDRHHEVSAQLNGFEEGWAQLESRPDDMVMFGNCVLFLCVPQIWESGAASQRRLEPPEVEITLNPIGWSPR
jgi:hypothetical protein